MTFRVPEQFRAQSGQMGSTARDGNNGVFYLPPVSGHRRFCIIASDGLGWEHVSVHMFSQGGRVQDTPTWEEMCHVKAMFWDDEDVVVQFHPRRSEYVNQHAHTLHLWWPTSITLPTPDPLLVGIPDEAAVR